MAVSLHSKHMQWSSLLPNRVIVTIVAPVRIATSRPGLPSESRSPGMLYLKSVTASVFAGSRYTLRWQLE
jgi:hypothetical protein